MKNEAQPCSVPDVTGVLVLNICVSVSLLVGDVGGTDAAGLLGRMKSIKLISNC